jgi:hypothetical protein
MVAFLFLFFATCIWLVTFVILYIKITSICYTPLKFIKNMFFQQTCAMFFVVI